MSAEGCSLDNANIRFSTGQSLQSAPAEVFVCPADCQGPDQMQQEQRVLRFFTVTRTIETCSKDPTKQAVRSLVRDWLFKDS